jgi:hypothetical protein
MNAPTDADIERHRIAQLEKVGLENEDVCGLCGFKGADKVPHPVLWPGERDAGDSFVHAECEDAECARAQAALSDSERESFLRTL